MKTRLQAALTATVSFFVLNFLNAQEGKLWATMNQGGTSDLGVIYTINPDGTNGAVIYEFNGLTGASPSGNLVKAANNHLYGTTTAGGNFGAGVIFSVDLSTNTVIPVYHFNKTDGWGPRDLLLGADGILYGTTSIGGTNPSPSFPNGRGVMYSYNPTNDAFNKLIDFDGQNNGENPQGLMQANNGIIYGTTRSGGDGTGVIYSYNPTNSTYTKLHNFTTLTGNLPTNCKLMQAADGKLYGMTTWGGANNMGVIYRYDLVTGYTPLHDLTSVDGAYPTGTLIQANNGKLYGVTSYGGNFGSGTLFSYNPITIAYSKLYNFNGASGAAPVSSLIQGVDGMLYGMASGGGQNGQGVIFTFDISNEMYSVIRDCSAQFGVQPMSSLLEIDDATTAIGPVLNQQNVSMFPNPAVNVLSLRTGDFKPERTIVRDLSGRNIMDVEFAPELNISALPSGVYFVELKNKDSFSRTKVFKL